jgi:hypothetical protein
MREFRRSYLRRVSVWTDHNERVWVGNFTSNPFEFEGSARAARPSRLCLVANGSTSKSSSREVETICVPSQQPAWRNWGSAW